MDTHPFRFLKRQRTFTSPTKDILNLRRQRLWVVGLLLVTLLIGLSGGVAFDRQVLAAFDPPGAIPAAAIPAFQLIGEAWNTINRVYVDHTALQPGRLAYGAISGMVAALGDTGHSRFLTPEMAQEQHNLTQGQFEGIGAEVQFKDGHVIIVAPLDGSPAQRAGLQPGDIILKVNGEEITHLPLDQVVKRILGPAGASVTLTILNPGSEQSRDVTLVRAHLTLHNVTWQRLPGTTTIAHVRVAVFSKGVSQDLKQALTDIHQQGLTGIILDLRNDPGGLLDEAVGVASQFLSRGNVVLERDAQGRTTPIAVQPGGLATTLPVVVLINQGTASGAEIVAGALQAAHRAMLVGEKTFGTGTVLNEFRLSDGSVLLLATEEWLTPDGHLIWRHGIAPDVVITLPPNTSLLLPELEQGMSSTQLQASGDQQLLQALALFTHPKDSGQ